MRLLCSLHTALATPMWESTPDDIQTTDDTKECVYCIENIKLAPIIRKFLFGEN